MMKGFLITPSLYSSWKYWMDSEEEGRTAILETLCKVEKEKSPAMQMGIDFENNIRKVCEGGTVDDPCVNEVAKIVQGGMWQQRISRELDGDLVYGIADVIKRNTIYDIKRIYQYELGKYEDSIQHLIYLYAAEIPNFEYLISDGREVYEEAYYWESKSLDLLKSRIADLKDSLLADRELSSAFIENWKYRKEETGE
jgi:hypothetical protein